MFKPHSFQTLIEGVPRIIMSPKAFNDMWIIVDEVSTEVGWLGSAYKRGADIFIQNIYLMKQQVHATTTELTPEGVAATGMEVLALPNGTDEFNALLFWGHSHVNMGTSPSAQDEDQMKLFRDSGVEFAVRGIFNKKKRAQFDIYFFKLGWTVRDAEWEVATALDDSSRDRWKSEIKDKVAPLVYTSTYYPPNGSGSYGGWNGGGYDGKYHGGSSYRRPVEEPCNVRCICPNTSCQKTLSVKRSWLGETVICPHCKQNVLAIAKTIPGPGSKPEPRQEKLSEVEHHDRVTEMSGEIQDDEYWYRPKPRTPNPASNGVDGGDPGDNDYPMLDEVLARHRSAIRTKNGSAPEQPKLPAPPTPATAGPTTGPVELVLEDPANPEIKK